MDNSVGSGRNGVPIDTFQHHGSDATPSVGSGSSHERSFSRCENGSVARRSEDDCLPPLAGYTRGGATDKGCSGEGREAS